MGALSAVVDKRGTNVINPALTLLETLNHRGSDAFGIASSHKAAVAHSTDELRQSDIGSNTLIGYSLAKVVPQDKAQPIQKDGSALAFDGRIFPAPAKGQIQFAWEKLKGDKDIASHFIRSVEGDYAFAVVRDDTIVVGRDAMGACPLYFGESENLCAVASERKALWTIGILKPHSFPPGTVAILDETGFQFTTAKTLSQPPAQELDMSAAVERLEREIRQSVEERVADVTEVAVAFSGGVDSSLVAFLAAQCSVDVHLIYVTLSRQREDFDFAEKAARTLGLRFHPFTYSLEGLERDLQEVLWLIEDPNPVNVCIAIPMYWAAEQSAKLGLQVMLTGQGSDELFGGYHRYLAEYAQRGLEGLQKSLHEDVASAYQSNFQRDNKACAFHKVELRMPFVDWDVVQLALSLPPSFKIESPNNGLRKRVLRQTAEHLGIPKLIAEKPKKAIQYTTGISRALRILGKAEGLTPKKYAEKIFMNAYKALK
jgi:asparagine synthase (glutamine-hydrolysing)